MNSEFRNQNSELPQSGASSAAERRFAIPEDAGSNPAPRSISRKPTRPLLRYFGGKWELAPQIVALFPPHRIYTEVFGGAGSVFFYKAPSEIEIYNSGSGRKA